MTDDLQPVPVHDFMNISIDPVPFPEGRVVPPGRRTRAEFSAELEREVRAGRLLVLGQGEHEPTVVEPPAADRNGDDEGAGDQAVESPASDQTGEPVTDLPAATVRKTPSNGRSRGKEQTS